MDYEDIAIVGVTGRFPGAPTLDQFWQNLISKKDSITEIPLERWDWRDFYSEKRTDAWKSVSKWGGFIEDIDKFDADFFGISRREAELIDPQARIFLESVWHVIEDAGYAPSRLRGTKTGLFLGVVALDYPELMIKNHLELDAYSLMGVATSITTNRISYLLDLKGSSEPLDTACASSLVAIHRAVRSIQNNENDFAIVGGVSALLSPSSYVALSKAGMLSPDGKCKTFSEGSNGYVRGEGVGAIFLKKLKQAEADKDHIYGVIKGSAVNHGGKANSITAPNADSQAEVISRALACSNVNPAQINYIECHGTGTELGDPIEVSALKNVFSKVPLKNHCGLGSVKTNIGHLENAAGMAGVIKVLLAMKNKKIPPTINFTKLNKEISLEDSPFYIQNELTEWASPRIAGVSAFGFGGVNAHLVIQEYVEQALTPVTENIPQLIVLSAKNEDRLKAQVENLLEFLSFSKEPPRLGDMALTLLTGRDFFEERLAGVFSSLDELKTFLKEYLLGNIKSSAVKKKASPTQTFKLDVENLVRGASLFCEGVILEAKDFYKNSGARKISLPGYPFAKTRFWFATKTFSSVSERLHPLIDANESTFDNVKFFRQWNGNEMLVRDHRISNYQVFPASGYVAMAAAATGLANPHDSKFKIKNMRWLKPLFIQEHDSKKLQISFFKMDAAHQADFVLTSGDEKYAMGQIVSGAEYQDPEPFSVAEKIQSCRENFMDKPEIYRRYAEANFNYGETFQVMDEIYISKTNAMAKISFPKKIHSEMKLYAIHPAMLDGVFQVAGPFMFANRFVYNFSLPYEVEELIVYYPLAGECYVYLEDYQDLGEIKKFNFKISNAKGLILAVIKGYAIKEVPMAIIQKLTAPRSSVSETVLYEPAWIPSVSSVVASEKKIVVSRINVGLAPKKVDENKTIQTVVMQIKKLISSASQKNMLFIHFHHGALIDRAFSGFFKTVMLENPWIECRSVEIPFKLKKAQVEKIVQFETTQYHDIGEIRYLKGRRETKTFIQIKPESQSNSIFKSKGFYLITGGAGALGFILAEYLCRHYQAEVLLTGRTSTNQSILSKIKKINQSGGRVVYQKADVTKPKQLLAALNEMKPKKLTGIFHLAGFIHDDKTINKSLTEIKKVLAPKIMGSQNLLKLAVQRKASFLMMFSSLTGALGNLGQADYALGNAYMDALAVHHETELSPRSQTRCFSVNWPLWQDGAMKGNVRLHRAAGEVTGLEPLETPQGLQMLEMIAGSRRPQTLVLQGNVRKIKNLLSLDKINPKSHSLAAADIVALKKVLQEKLLALVSEELKTEAGLIKIDADLTQYGFDSISVMDYMFGLNKLLNLELEPTIFYEHNTIEKISDYLAQKHGDQISEFLNLK